MEGFDLRKPPFSHNKVIFQISLKVGFVENLFGVAGVVLALYTHNYWVFCPWANFFFLKCLNIFKNEPQLYFLN